MGALPASWTFTMPCLSVTRILPREKALRRHDGAELDDAEGCEPELLDGIGIELILDGGEEEWLKPLEQLLPLLGRLDGDDNDDIEDGGLELLDGCELLDDGLLDDGLLDELGLDDPLDGCELDDDEQQHFSLHLHG